MLNYLTERNVIINNEQVNPLLAHYGSTALFVGTLSQASSWNELSVL